MRKPFVLYVAGPYRAKTLFGVFRNVYRARLWAQRLFDAGYVVLCPHSASAFMKGPDRTWLMATLELMKRCDGVALLPNWASSEGARQEQMTAVMANLPVAGVEEWIRNPKNFFTVRGEPDLGWSCLGNYGPRADGTIRQSPEELRR